MCNHGPVCDRGCGTVRCLLHSNRCKSNSCGKLGWAVDAVLACESLDIGTRIIVGSLDDLDEITGAEDVSSWRSCLRVETVSKAVRQHIHPCIAQMQLSLRREIRMQVDVEQFDSKSWSLNSSKCAMRKCNQRTGIFVPWHEGHDVYHPGSSSYSGPLATRGERAMCSINGPGRIDDRINEKGPHLVVCSFGCLQHIHRLKALWPRFASEPA